MLACLGWLTQILVWCGVELVEAIAGAEAVLDSAKDFCVAAACVNVHAAHGIGAVRRSIAIVTAMATMMSAVADVCAAPKPHHEKENCGEYQKTHQAAHCRLHVCCEG
jgi:hypothetical protein